jgi:A/G-specific adenine glycosylase
MTALLDWYETVKRPLPWRETRDPYALLVSEVMLQQTQAARVVPYYEAFLGRFPTAEALAAAPLEEVLKAWSGLGYNRRGLALQRAAAHVAAHGWPEDLTELPGVGPYTAAAVGSFAWDRQTAAVDTNVRRVLERTLGRPLTGRALQSAADAAVPPGRAADHNQAMMELGATVCTARVARCGSCPLEAACASAHRVQIAPKRPRKAVRFEDTERYARGRVLRSVLHGEPDGLDPVRRERALAGLRADGLVGAR